MRAIRRQAAAIGRTREAVLAFAPGLLEGWLDPAAWRDQLIAAAEPTGSDEQGELADGKKAQPPEPDHITFRAGTKQALIAGLLAAGAGRHAGRADRRHRLAAAHHPGGPHRPAPQGLHPGEEHAARTARPPTGSCRPTRRRQAMLPRARRPEAMPLDPKRAAAAEVEIAQLRDLDLEALQARWHSLRGRPAPKAPAQASAAAAPRLPAAGGRPWRPRSRHATLPRSDRPSGRLRHR